MNVTGIVVRVPVVVLAALVALAAALGLGAGTARAASGEQVWGFVDAPSVVQAGWQSPLTVSWRNFSGEDQTYRVVITGPGVDWQDTIAVPAEENSFSRQVAAPVLPHDGDYRARLFLVGSDDELAAATIHVGAPRLIGVSAGNRAITPAGTVAQRRSVTTFGVDVASTVTGRIVGADGRRVWTRTVDVRGAGEQQRLTWSGKDTAGRTVPAGRYRLTLVARAGAMSSSQAITLRVVR